MVGEPVVLVNRTKRNLTFIADGRGYTLTPGDNYGYHTGHVRFAKSQNPVMGTEDYFSRTFQSLVGVKGTKDDCSLIDESAITASERFDVESLEPLAQKGRAVESARYRPSQGRLGPGAGTNAIPLAG